MINASGGPVGERVDYWRSVLRDRLGISARIDPAGAGDFEQSVEVSRLGDVVIAERLGSPFHAKRAACEGSDQVMAVLNVEGHFFIDSPKAGEVCIAPGKILVFPLAEAGNLRFVESTRHIVLSIPSRLLAEQCPEWRDLAAVPLDQSVAPVRMLFDLAQSMLQHSDGLGPHCRSAGGNMLVGLLASALSAQDEGEASQSTRMQGFHLQRIRNYILSHLCDPTLDTPGIAAGVGLSLRYVHRLFAEEPLHLMQWVLEQRLRRCHEAIMAAGTAAVSISQIAYRWGFNDAAHFSRTFRKRFGVSPREVAEQARRTLNPPIVHDQSIDRALSGKAIALQHPYS
jgi:AraC-like DNA-binding protein